MSCSFDSHRPATPPRQYIEEDIPKISGNIDDISSQEEEILFVEVTRDQSGFGFSIQGGAEYEAPLFVLKIAPGGAAEKDGRLRVSG